MVSEHEVHKQLKRLGFKHFGWGRGEVQELPHVLLPDEEIHELVNGIYEGGFALLVATDVRVLLIDKKPMNYLTVEDLRFDMINEMDYNHRLLGAEISIATGNKNLRFRSYNQPRLRKLIGHVQHSMADIKKQANSHQEDQKSHLEQINQQLQAYLMAQQQQQFQLQQQLAASQATGAPPPQLPEPVKPSPELSDYLFAQSLLAQHQEQTGRTDVPLQPEIIAQVQQFQQAQPVQPPEPVTPLPPTRPATNATPTDDLYAEGMREIFGKHAQPQPTNPVAAVVPAAAQIAYSKLPMALRNRKFGRPSFHAHSEAPTPTEVQTATY